MAHLGGRQRNLRKTPNPLRIGRLPCVIEVCRTIKNFGLSAPQTGAITRLRYGPSLLRKGLSLPGFCTSRVIFALECPSLSATIFTLSPLGNARVADVYRRSWNRMVLSPASLRSGFGGSTAQFYPTLADQTISVTSSVTSRSSRSRSSLQLG